MNCRIFPVLTFSIAASLAHGQNPCEHIFNEVQLFEGLSAEDIAPLRTGCETDLQADMLGYWQCMDQRMQHRGYHLDNMLSLGDECKNAQAKPLADMATD